MALTAKKRAFVQAKKAGKSNKDAAVAAGYSVKTAGPAGSRLVKDADVVAALKKQAAAPAPDAGWPFPNADHPNPARAAAPAVEPAAPRVLTAREYLSEVVNDLELDEKLRLDAAKKLIEFEEPKLAPMGKKAAKTEAAKGVARGRFAAAAGPQLAAANGQRV